MENARKIRGVARNESQRALLVESLETVEQLPGNFQVWFHSKTDQNEFIHFFRRANGECCRSDAGDRKVRLYVCTPGGAEPSFPNGQTIDRSLLEILIVCDCANHLCKRPTGLDQVELSRLA